MGRILSRPAHTLTTTDPHPNPLPLRAASGQASPGRGKQRGSLANPVTEDTVPFPIAGEPDAMATVVFPFVVIFRFFNAETVDIANITWAPGSPGADPRLPSRL